jgi:hypothetical protein
MMTDADRIAALECALIDLVNAMDTSFQMGCTAYLDRCADGGAFWYDSVAEARRLLNK